MLSVNTCMKSQLELNNCHQSQNCQKNGVHLTILEAEISGIFAPLSVRVCVCVLYKANLPHRECICLAGVHSGEHAFLMRWYFQFNECWLIGKLLVLMCYSSVSVHSRTIEILLSLLLWIFKLCQYTQCWETTVFIFRGIWFSFLYFSISYFFYSI